jgi:hypothetical protein
MMRFDLALYLFVLLLVILLCLLLYRLWRDGKSTPAALKAPRPRRDPKPFVDLTRKSDCKACTQGVESHRQVAAAPPPV